MEEFNGEMLDSGLEVERMGVMLNIKKNEQAKRGQDGGTIES